MPESIERQPECFGCGRPIGRYVRWPVQVTDEMVERALEAWRYGPLAESRLSTNLLSLGVHDGCLEATITSPDGDATWGEALPADVTRAAVRRLLDSALNGEQEST